VGSSSVATIVGVAMITGGCTTQPGLNGDPSSPDFSAPSSWTWAQTPPVVPSALVENASAESGNAKSHIAKPRLGLVTLAAPTTREVPKQQSRVVAVVDRSTQLAPVDERPLTIEPDPVITTLRSSAPDATTHTSIWTRLRAGMQLPFTHPEHLREHIAWIGSHERYFRRVTQRGLPYLHYIMEEVQKRGMPAEVALLPIIESGFKPFAYSSSKAAGIWQIIPSTGKQLGLKMSWWYDGRRDIIDSTGAALDYLQLVNNNLDGDWLLSLAAYNAGEGAVRRARSKAAAKGKSTDFWSIRPYLPRETRSYVPRLLAVAAAVRDPPEFGLTLHPVPNESYLEVVELGSQIDIGVAAKALGMKVSKLQLLNPGFQRWATDPDGPHRLLVPKTRARRLLAALGTLPPEQRLMWRRHAIQRGQSLSQIAAQYGTPTEVLRRVNRISSNSIRAGKNLLVPVSGQGMHVYALALPPKTTKKHRPDKQKKARSRKQYTVRNGDSMLSIADRHDTSIDALANANSLSRKAVLKIGQRMHIPAAARSQGKARKVAARSGSRSAKAAVYRVRKGDSLWTIARRAGISLAELRRWNAMKTTTLRPGQVLKLHPPQKRRES